MLNNPISEEDACGILLLTRLEVWQCPERMSCGRMDRKLFLKKIRKKQESHLFWEHGAFCKTLRGRCWP
jgi:hypothetical protein